MPLTVKKIANAMERWAPKAYAYDWDPVGLSVGSFDARVKTVLCCLSLDEGALNAAKKTKAQMIVSHHPLIFRPLKNLVEDNAHTCLCLALHDAKISCYSAHTNLDVAPGGVNSVLADTLGLKNTRVLFPAAHAEQVKLAVFVPGTHLAPLRDALAQAGAGVIGDYTHCSFSTPGTGTFLPGKSTAPFSGKRGVLNEEAERRFEMLVNKKDVGAVLTVLYAAHPYEEPAYDLVPLLNTNPEIGLGLLGDIEKPLTLKQFAKQVRIALGIRHLRFSGDPKKKVQRVAVMGGAGGGEVGKIPADVDVFVTGDVKYHNALDAVESGLAVIDAGHWGTEKGIVPVMAKFLSTEFKGLAVKTYIELDIFQWEME